MDRKEDGILLAQLKDRIRQCEDNYTMTNSTFLDMRQRQLAEDLCRNTKGLLYGFYGGYEDAERMLAVFFPDYVQFEAGDNKTASIQQYFLENGEENPLTVIRAESKPGARPLTHRDYLGSLMALGLKRETIGDILVGPNGADILLLSELADFLLLNYDKAGRVDLTLRQVPINQLLVPEGRREECSDTVASLRLDNVVAAVFSTSRGKAAEAIKGGVVFVNGLQIYKPDAAVKEGDKLVLRGRGKVLLKKVGGQTRKDRIFITFERFL